MPPTNRREGSPFRLAAALWALPKDTRGAALRLTLDADGHTPVDVEEARSGGRPGLVDRVVPGGTSIAAQTAHAAYYVELLDPGMRGVEPVSDWPGSFRPAIVDEETWGALRERLHTSLGRFRAWVTSDVEWNERRLGDALGMLAHTAYHLGSVRQMMRATGASIDEE